MKDKQTMTCADLLIRLLRDTYGVRALFGIPGVHTVELYRGLEGSDVQHITPRHEQGAGFMADGYARASGKPGVCLRRQAARTNCAVKLQAPPRTTRYVESGSAS